MKILIMTPRSQITLFFFIALTFVGKLLSALSKKNKVNEQD